MSVSSSFTTFTNLLVVLMTFVFPPVRSQRATGIGRLMVNIVEGIELKPCRSHGIKPSLEQNIE